MLQRYYVAYILEVRDVDFNVLDVGFDVVDIGFNVNMVCFGFRGVHNVGFELDVHVVGLDVHDVGFDVHEDDFDDVSFNLDYPCC